MPDPLDLDALEALLAAGTPGPWTHAADEDPPFPDIEHDGGKVADVAMHANDRTITARGEEFSRGDARLITAAVNALPAHIAEIRRLRAVETLARRIGDAETIGEQEDAIDALNAALGTGLVTG